MFTHIRTSKDNREVIATLTRRLNLGTENIVSRIALTYSLSKDRKMDLKNIQNSSGKEYSEKVLFGDYIEYYIGMVALNYGIHVSDKDLGKYIKMHIDDGLQILNEEITSNSNIDGFDFLVEKIETSLLELT